MPAFLPTGSLTGLAFLAGLALLIRIFRRSQTVDERASDASDSRFGTLSASTLYNLIDNDVVRHFLIDVRGVEQVESRPSPEILRRASGGFLQIPSNTICDLKKMFTRRSSGEFLNRFPGSLYPRKNDLIVCVADEIKDCKKAVTELHSLNFECSVYLKVGLEVLRTYSYQPFATKFISRHSVAVLLGLTDIAPPVEATVIDVRRTDEHVVYGSIEKTKHLVANVIPKALTLDKDHFYEYFLFNQPDKDSLIITSSRVCKRAIWAAQLLTEMGYTRVFVHHTGTYGWHFSQSVKVYDSYETNEEYPLPKTFTLEKPDISIAQRELEELQVTTKIKNPFSDIINGVPEPMGNLENII